MCTSAALSVMRLITYVYDLFTQGGSRIRVRLCVQSNLLRMYTTCVLEASCAYECGFARKSTYCVCIQLVRSRRPMYTSTALRVKRLIIQGLSLLVDVVMTVVGY